MYTVQYVIAAAGKASDTFLLLGKYLIDPTRKMLGKYLGKGRKVYLIVSVGK
jgi:hypothetical protein